ncbi:HTTM domain-containing protein [Nannocystis punicea]|uniref:HTTM domain-containing protein n=1 Tax=Nannocystis punicea TaxID=2995304 RepID=A0ABY7HES0_9BACT|nr:HTTM domain-containing protein [Nannocystis poenicansa]WAS97623.1 HTTM domain-containing protein [Nannocystis poenicansa]
MTLESAGPGGGAGDVAEGAGREGHGAKDSRGRLARLRDALLTGREDPAALGLLRIGLVAVFTASLLSHVGAVAEYFSAASPLAGQYARQAFPTRWSLFFMIDDPLAVQAIFAAGVVAHLLWLVGLFTRPAALFSALVWVSMVGRNPLLYAMPDQLHSALIVWLALMPTGRGLSLDARWRGKGGPVPVWCRRIVHLQLAVMYTSTGLAKHGATWKSEGTAIYFSLVSPYNRHFDLTRALAMLQPYVLRPITWLVLAWEVGFSGFVLAHWLRERWRKIPDMRWLFLGFGVAMHVGIQMMMYVEWFTPMTLASYLAFLRPDEVRRLVRRFSRQ